MRTSHILPPLLCGLGLLLYSVPSHAQNLGGGLIEFLVTGGEMRERPQPRLAPRRPAVETPYAQPAALRPGRDIPDAFRRTEVDYSGDEKIGSIVVDTPNHYLYLVTGPGRALRYGIGVARPGFAWGGHKTVSRKAEWPDWTPPAEMMQRRPDLPAHMEGGPGNPLGARALYLGSSLYRIHGTNEPWTIGQNVSSGCIRMMNEDVIDLYERVRIGADVTVL
ncbi:L,D-transpeptidase catalytic domain [Rhodoblastus acidophilus]|uniref:L,D-transpeptidase catalytic domain n=1 Tax=Rhodoblastus acidophilus TaxID=1074 RepID=A0A212RKR1_RHOAC|nr:L,D-transpeptidase [Rhodoblastus acidophilus]SNB73058.1 L,D-transpeptidase catalytic domain [Rhodoblastus acidophilus]